LRKERGKVGWSGSPRTLRLKSDARSRTGGRPREV
jgi:hypothetical protein